MMVQCVALPGFRGYTVGCLLNIPLSEQVHSQPFSLVFAWFIAIGGTFWYIFRLVWYFGNMEWHVTPLKEHVLKSSIDSRMTNWFCLMAEAMAEAMTNHMRLRLRLGDVFGELSLLYDEPRSAWVPTAEHQLSP